jgi:DNA-binding NarL/FixJ family response regulator
MRPSSASPQRISLVVSQATRVHCELLLFTLKRAQPRFAVLGTYSTSKQLIEAAQRLTPDIVLVSMNLEDGPAAGLTATRTTVQQNPNTSVILLMDTKNRELVVEAFRAGAKGVVSQNEGLDALCKCIQCVYNGQVWADGADMNAVLKAFRDSVTVRPTAANGKELLTPRQMQVVSLVAVGMSNREISERLQLSEHTVKNYLFRIFDKLGVSSRSELIIYALNHLQTHTAALDCSAGGRS